MALVFFWMTTTDLFRIFLACHRTATVSDSANWTISFHSGRVNHLKYLRAAASEGRCTTRQLISPQDPSVKGGRDRAWIRLEKILFLIGCRLPAGGQPGLEDQTCFGRDGTREPPSSTDTPCSSPQHILRLKVELGNYIGLGLDWRGSNWTV